MDFHRIPSYIAFPKIKDPELDAMAKDLYNAYTEERLIPILAGEDYRNQPNTPEGGAAQYSIFKQALNLSKKDVYDHLISTVGQKHELLINEHSDDVEGIKKTGDQLIFLHKIKFSELSETQKSIGKAEYIKAHGQPSHWRDWQKLYAIAAAIKG